MNHLIQENDVVASLENLNIVVVSAGEHGRPRVEAENAALAEIAVLRALGRTARRSTARVSPLLPAGVNGGSCPSDGSMISEV
jgi:hypothetical protein